MRCGDADTRVRDVEADRAAGRIPAAIVVSLGTTGVTAFDPLADIVAIAQRHGVSVTALPVRVWTRCRACGSRCTAAVAG